MRASGTSARRPRMNAAATEAITGSADTIAITTTIGSMWSDLGAVSFEELMYDVIDNAA